jgi:protease-4
MERNRSGFGSRLAIVLALACILLVSGLGYLYFTERGGVERNMVGVIHIEGAITSAEAAGIVTAVINRAISNSSVKAVVIKIDSPGGSAHLVEQIYLDILELKQHKPVVASVVTALSGGYYIAVAADYIYTHPSSFVGNVGVMGVAPENLLPSEMNLESGPYKTTGFSKLLFPFNLSHALENFGGAVEAGRGSRLRLTPVELRKGMIYIGSEAVNAGLVDDVGSLQRAAEHAATEAGLETYMVVDIISGAGVSGLSTTYQNETSFQWRDMTVATLNRLNPPPAIYYLYLPLQAYQPDDGSTVSTTDEDNITAPKATGKGQVVVDLSHGNNVSPWVLNLLSAELAMRGVYTGYGDTWEEVESALNSASCLIVAEPTTAYSKDEFKTIDSFVNEGRMLLMFFDPASEYTEAQNLLSPINSLANRYGLTFGKGYLYNMDDHYGIYRNIYIRRFGNTSLTQKLESLVLFTATYLHSTDSDAAWTPDDTFASVAERRGSYAPLSVIDKGNGTVAAFGDITFLMEPYAYVEDNYQLLMNIVSAVAEIEVPVVEEEEEPEFNISEPDLPVGTVKIYTERVDGKEQEVRWIRMGENETRVERPDRVTFYHFDEEGGLVRWKSNGVEQVYDSPLIELSYPLFEGKAWAYEVGYNLSYQGNVSRGLVRGNGQVKEFEDMADEKGERYLCAKVFMTERDELARYDHNITSVYSKYLWIAHEVGMVKAESEVSYYIDGELAYEETRSLLLASIEKEEG